VSDLRPSIDAALGAFALDAVVTPPDQEAVETVAFWLPPTTIQPPTGSEFRRAELRRVLVLPLVGLPEVPRGTVVAVAEFDGGDVREWKIDEAERLDFDHYRAVVVPVIP
jgi:hypothetical protein